MKKFRDGLRMSVSYVFFFLLFVFDLFSLFFFYLFNIHKFWFNLFIIYFFLGKLTYISLSVN